jgi:hypothetical protein
MARRRLQNNTRAWAYRYLVLRDGEKCAICGIVPTAKNKSSTAKNTFEKNSTLQNGAALNTATRRSSTLRNQKNTLDIDHINGNPRDNSPDNLRLLCHKCNVTISNKARPRSSGSCDERERERLEGLPATRIAREDANYRAGSPEMQANLLYEVEFRRWIMVQVTGQGSYDYNTAVNEGAEVIGCSPLTTARYLAKLLSPSGPLTEMKDALGHRVLILKPYLESA